MRSRAGMSVSRQQRRYLWSGRALRISRPATSGPKSLTAASMADPKPARPLCSLFKSSPTHDVPHDARRAQPIRWPERMAESRLCNLRGNSARQAAPASGRVAHLEPNRDSPGRRLLTVHVIPPKADISTGLNKSFSREPVSNRTSFPSCRQIRSLGRAILSRLYLCNRRV